MADADNAAPPPEPAAPAAPLSDEQPGEAVDTAAAAGGGAAEPAEAPAEPHATATATSGGPAEPADSAEAPARPRARTKAAAEVETEAAAGQAADVDSAEAAEAAEAAAVKAPAKRSAKTRETETTAASGEAAATPGTGDSADFAGTAVSGRAGLKLHHLRPAPGARRAKVRVGRGEASKGKTAGRGTKGTRARDNVPARFEGGQMPLHRRVPKLKGFSNLRFKTTYQVVNTGRLAELYPQGGEVTPDDLVAKGAVRRGELVKVLGTGDLGIALRVSAHAFSASAKEKITAAGGSATEV